MKIPIGAWVALGGVFFSALALIPRLKQKNKKRIVVSGLIILVVGFFLIGFADKSEAPNTSNQQTIAVSGNNNTFNGPVANNVSVIVTDPPPKPYLFPQDIWEANTPTDGGFVTRIGVMVAYESFKGTQQIKGLTIKSKQNLPRAEMSSNSAGTTQLMSGESVPFKEHIFTWVTTNKIDPKEIEIGIIQ